MPFRYYIRLKDQVDRWVSATTKRFGKHVVCRKKCDACCQKQFSVSAVEAYSIAEGFQTLSRQAKIEVRRPKESCSFLLDGECSIYSNRPVICRTFGLPARLPSDQRGGVDWCELNFTETDSDFTLPAEGILDIETLNVKLAAINHLFLKETGLARISHEWCPKLHFGDGKDVGGWVARAKMPAEGSDWAWTSGGEGNDDVKSDYRDSYPDQRSERWYV